jgi:hypothetical protein
MSAAIPLSDMDEPVEEKPKKGKQEQSNCQLQ